MSIFALQGITVTNIQNQERSMPTRSVENSNIKNLETSTAQAEQENVTTFRDLEISATLCEALEKMGIKTPTPIQEQSIPPAMKGSDILASARTGSGKTISYLLPLLMNLAKSKDEKAIIVLPTRELAAQVADILFKICQKEFRFGVVLLIGGEAIRGQLVGLSKNPRIIVGTPGRICDHLSRKSLSLSNVSFMVLDEVDRMLDFGFAEELDTIRAAIIKKTQTFLFSATVPKEIERVANKYLENPVRVSVGSSVAPTADVDQKVVHVKNQEKYDLLVQELTERNGSIIVFVKTKRSVEELSDQLKEDNLEVDGIHGDLRQRKRDKIIASFRKQKYKVMVATDVVARGLDIPHVRHVINYDLPTCPEDYVHRIGRTGRAGEKGNALSFISPQDTQRWRSIELFINPEKKSEKSSYAGNGAGRDRSFGSNRRSSGRRDFGNNQRSRSERGGFGDGFRSKGNFERSEDRPKRFGGQRDSGFGRSNDFSSSERSPQRSFARDGFKKDFSENPRPERSFEKPSFGAERSFERKPRFEKFAGQDRQDRGFRSNSFKENNRDFGYAPKPKFGFQDRADRPAKTRSFSDDQGFSKKPFSERSFDRPSGFNRKNDGFERSDRFGKFEKSSSFSKDKPFSRPESNFKDKKAKPNFSSYSPDKKKSKDFDREAIEKFFEV